MTPTHQKSASFPSVTSEPSSSSEVFTQDILWENYKQQAILVEKYKQQLALLDNYKKQALYQRLYNAKQMEQQNIERSLSADLSNSGGGIVGEMAKLDDEQYEAFKRQQQQQQVDLLTQQQLVNGGPPMRKLSTGSASSSSSKEPQPQQQLAEQFKQMSMQDTLQKRTLAMQESIRQTLAAASTSNDLNNNPLPPSLHQSHHNSPPGTQHPASPGGFDPRTLDDLNIIDMLADPRWSGAKQYRGFEEGRDPHRRDNGIDDFYFSQSVFHFESKVELYQAIFHQFQSLIRLNAESWRSFGR